MAQAAQEIVQDVVRLGHGAADKLSSLLDADADADAVRNDALYAPLSSREEASEPRVCGVGASLALVHDPPLDLQSRVKPDYYTYVLRVHGVGRGTPARRAGVREGDILLAIDGERLEYGRRVYLPEEAAGRIRGEEGTGVTITVQRDGRDLEFELVREAAGTAPEGRVAPAVPATPVTP